MATEVLQHLVFVLIIVQQGRGDHECYREKCVVRNHCFKIIGHRPSLNYPTDECIATMKKFDIPCVCRAITADDERTISVHNLVQLARMLGVEVGYRCGTMEAMSRRLSDATTEQSSNDDSSVDERPKPRKEVDSTSVKTKAMAPKIILHDPKWTDGSIPLDGLSDKLSKIGQEAIERRDASATAAASALQEALITESVIRHLSKFSDICSSSKTSNPLPTVDVFLAVYEDTLKWKTIAESVVSNEADEAFLEKSANHWVDAALATDLEVLKLLNGATESISRTKNMIRSKVPSVEAPRTSMSKKQSLGASAKVHSKASPIHPLSCAWSNTEG
ncbi:hypothetical protein ACP70R_046912 [Stipagrostis hirtigluma subsp. patula]